MAQSMHPSMALEVTCVASVTASPSVVSDIPSREEVRLDSAN